MSFWAELLENVKSYFIVLLSSNNIFLDILDILIVTFILYKSIQFIRQTRAEQLIKGIIMFVFAYVIAQLLNLKTLAWIMSIVYLNAIVVLVVLFQPEIRAILEKMGRGSFSGITRFSGEEETRVTEKMITELGKACESMHKALTGALIVIERKTKLNEIISTGTVVDATPSKEIICNIFFKNSPLHDGAMIIRDDKVYAASCILPLTSNAEVDNDLGTRHRAAIGMSEISDAIVIVVSEETGIVSVVCDGKIERNYSELDLKQLLRDELIGEQEDNGDTNRIKKYFAKLKEGKDHEKK